MVFLYQELKIVEELDFLDRIESCQEEYTIEMFDEKQFSFETIAVLTNVSKDPKHVNADCKNRGGIEQMIDVLKNVVEANRTYMQNEQGLEGWMFINLQQLKIPSIIRLRKSRKKISHRGLKPVYILTLP